MEENKEPVRPVNPRRKKLSKVRIFKEVYLPVIIFGIAIIFIVSFIIGAIVRTVQKNEVTTQASIQASIAQATEEALQRAEAQELIVRAEQQALSYDYQGAIQTLESFSGNLLQYPELSSLRDTYVEAQRSMIPWDDPSQVMNLSFQLLIPDPERAFQHQVYGSSFRNNFITTVEFSRILQQLYENGYILVSLDDIVAAETNAEGATIYTPKTLYLPNGKKPIMLTQTNVNYNLYLIDSDQDMLPDKDGGGFASKLMLDSNGRFTNEMVDSSGQTVTGAFDLVPILDDFVANHPDFSYRGAKAILSLTGYNGLFGYRTHPAGVEKFGQDAYNQAVQDVGNLAASLRQNGYTLACYTYENVPYGEIGIAQLQADLKSWQDQVEPILGHMDILVYAQKSDITTDKDYSGEKYETLQNAGFRYYLGLCQDGKQFTQVTEQYVRQGRIMVTGQNLSEHSDWFVPYFDTDIVKDEARK